MSEDDNVPDKIGLLNMEIIYEVGNINVLGEVYVYFSYYLKLVSSYCYVDGEGVSCDVFFSGEIDLMIDVFVHGNVFLNNGDKVYCDSERLL